MNGEDHPHSEADVPKGQAPTSIAEGQNAMPAKPATAIQLEQTEERIEERMSAFERSMIRLTRAGIIIGIVTGVIFLGQLYEMYEGGTQTDRLVGYAQTQAQAASDISQSSEDFTDSAYWMEEHMQDAASAMQQNADATEQSLRDTEQSIRNTQNAFREEQRAWIAAVNVSIEGMEVDAIPKGKITWFNSGKTFAKHLIGVAHLRFLPDMVSSEKDLLEIAKTGTIAQQASVTVVPPQSGTQSILLMDHKSTPTEKAYLDTLYTYLWGEVTYEDVFGRKHTTVMCSYRKGTVGEFLQCHFHNDAD